jgi:hypothetical protein
MTALKSVTRLLSTGSRLHSIQDEPSSGEPLEGSGFENEIPEEEFSEDPAAVPVTPEKEEDRG